MKKAPSLLPSPVERSDNDAVIGNKQESERASIWRGDAAIAACSGQLNPDTQLSRFSASAGGIPSLC
ncbi:hypothetical protein ACK308_17955, partial [Aeromonas caviae]